MYCPNCKTELPQDSSFCYNCKNKIDIQQESNSSNNEKSKFEKLSDYIKNREQQEKEKEIKDKINMLNSALCCEGGSPDAFTKEDLDKISQEDLDKIKKFYNNQSYSNFVANMLYKSAVVILTFGILCGIILLVRELENEYFTGICFYVWVSSFIFFLLLKAYSEVIQQLENISKKLDKE